MKIFACLLLLAVCTPSVFVTAQVTEDQIAFCIIDGFYWDTYSIQYFFFDTTYGRWSAQTKTLQSGYPKDISVGWPGIPNRFDAVLDYTLPNHLYFFKAGQYWRWSIGGIDQADPPYPRSISAWWPGVPDNLNAAFKWMNQYYFLSGTQYYIFDPVQNQVTESGLISSKWPGIPSNLDTAFVYSDTWLYFFKGLKYWRWDLTGAAPSYPKNICDNWGICNYMLCAIQVAPIAPAFAAQSAAVTTQQFVTASNIQPSNATTSSNSTSTLRGFVSTTSTEQPAPGPDTNATESATAQTFVSAASINSNSTTP